MSGRMMKYLLGGTSTPMAGDGFGLAVPARPAPSPKLTTPNSAGSGASTDYFSRTRSKSNVSARSNTSAASQNPSPLPSPHPQDHHPTIMPDVQLFGSSQHVSRMTDARKPPRMQNGVRAPRCSLANLAAATTSSPRPSMDSFQTAPSTAEGSPRTETPDVMGETSWEDYEIPQELEFVRGDTPKEIRNIIQESLDEHRAIKASRLQSQAIVVRTTIESSRTSRKEDRSEVPECSSIISARSTPDSERVTNRSASSLSISRDSATSLESEVEDTGFLRPPKALGRSQANSSQESLRSKTNTNISPSMAALEKRLQESQERTNKSHKLFKLLPGRKRKSEISLEPQMPAEPASYECTSCFGEVPDKKAVDMPCHHKYCSPCFSQFVLTATSSEATFPPKCCLQEIPKKTMREYLPPKALAQFDEKALEYAVAIGNRYYCVSSKCAKWIDTRIARRVNGILECPHCAVKLCTTCRGPQHSSTEDCPQDYGLGPTLDQAERAGWRRCYRCRALVELTSGCRHITCKCRAEFCYTCGAKWRTCACTEADQARREGEIATRLARFEADQRAEEEEMRAAIAAVEEAERQLREEREAEEARIEAEAREMTQREFERLQNINDHFEYLRGVLDRIRLQQRQSIERRHDRDWDEIELMKDKLESPEAAAERERYVAAEREKIVATTEGTIKTLQRRFATEMMETITRHRKDQDDLMAMTIDNPDQDADIMKADILQELMPVQELERSTLKSQQAREIAKWKARGEQSIRAFDSKMVSLKMRLEEAERINGRAKEMKKRVFADTRWFEAVFLERTTMLGEDERKFILSGSDAPAWSKAERDSSATMIGVKLEENGAKVATIKTFGPGAVKQRELGGERPSGVMVRNRADYRTTWQP